MYRSGSTWQFNVARLILEDSGVDYWAGWIGDLDPAETGRIRLIKVHSPQQAPQTADLVLTTWRPLADCLGSRVRMGWLASTREAVREAFRDQQLIYNTWHSRSDLETDYYDITHNPLMEISRIDACLTAVLTLPNDASRPHRIYAHLNALVDPIRAQSNADVSYDRYDRTTLLHPGHRSLTGAYTLNLVEWLEGLEQERLPPRRPSGWPRWSAIMRRLHPILRHWSLSSSPLSRK
jgi:hypothetical protein